MSSLTRKLEEAQREEVLRAMSCPCVPSRSSLLTDVIADDIRDLRYEMAFRARQNVQEARQAQLPAAASISELPISQEVTQQQ